MPVGRCLSSPDDLLFGGKGRSRQLAGDAEQGLTAKIETRPALSGRGAEFWWMERPLLSRLRLQPCLLGSQCLLSTSHPELLTSSPEERPRYAGCKPKLSVAAAAQGACL